MVRLDAKDKPTVISFLVLTGLFLTVIFQSINLDSRTGLATQALETVYDITTTQSIAGYDTTIIFTEPYSGAIIVDGSRTEVLDETSVTVSTPNEPKDVLFQPAQQALVNEPINAAAIPFSNSCNDITNSGSYLLSGNIFVSTASNSPCINILADNVIFDCGGNNINGQNIGQGILFSGNNVTIRNCEITSMGTGIFVDNSANSYIYDNNLYNNINEGINILSSTNIIIYTNYITNNNGRGILLDSSGASGNVENNWIYDNHFNNSLNVEFRNGEYANTWQYDPLNGNTNILGGSVTRGNYWVTPSGAGYSEDAALCEDWNNNSFCDDPYVLNSQNQDTYPLTFIRALPVGNLAVEPAVCNYGQTCDYNLTTDGIFDPETSIVYLYNASNGNFVGIYSSSLNELIISDNKIELVGNKFAVGEISVQIQDRRGIFTIPDNVIVMGPPVCGDGVVQQPYETCDDGNTVSGDGCSASCFIEVTPVTINSVSPTSCDTETGCVITLTLSNALGWNAGEETIITITDSNNNDLVWAYEPDIITPDYTIQASDITSGGSQVRLTIPSNVYVVGSTNINLVDRTTNTDYDYTSFSITTSIIPPVCGDGLLDQATEACDDSNTLSGDGCSASCTLETGFICTGEPSLCSVNSCGATISQPGFYYLYTDINTPGSDCVTINSDDVIFDCQNNIISSNSQTDGTNYYSGIRALGNNITLNSCINNGFYYNIFGAGDELTINDAYLNNGAYAVYYSDSVGSFTSTNVDASNNYNGYYIEGNGIITNSDVSNSSNTYLTVASGGNLVLNNLHAENNRPILYYNSPVTLFQTDIGNAMGIVLFNAVGSQLNNLQMSGGGSGAAIVSRNSDLQINGGLFEDYSRAMILRGPNNIVNGATIKNMNAYGIVSSFESDGLVIKESIFENILSNAILVWKPNTAQNLFINNNTFNLSTENYFNLVAGIGPDPVIDFNYNTWLLLDGTGYSESNSCVDNDFDGICNSAFTVFGSYSDNFPRVNDFLPPPTCSENALYGVVCSAGVGQCSENGIYDCQDPNSFTEVPSCNAVPSAPITEICGDGLDNDCNGVADNGCITSLTVNPTTCDLINDCTVTFTSDLDLDYQTGIILTISDGSTIRVYGSGGAQFSYPISQISSTRFSLVIPANSLQPSTATATLTIEDPQQQQATTQLTITNSAPVCNDGTIEGNEVCEQNDLNGNSCSSIGQGFNSGTLSCSNDCLSFNTSQCTTLPEVVVSCGDTISAPGLYILDQDQTATGNCITIDSSDVILDCRGYSMTGSGSGTGIIANRGSDNLEIMSCEIADFDTAISSDTGGFTNIHNNNLTGFDPTSVGISFCLVQDSLIHKNTIRDTWKGILFECDSVLVDNNSLYDNTVIDSQVGIDSIRSNTKLYGNLIRRNSVGITLQSDGSQIFDNEFYQNTNVGIHLHSYNSISNVNNLIKDNRILFSNIGILLEQSGSGILQNNQIYNNFFNNSDNIAISGSVGNNQWSRVPPISGTNIFGSSVLGGNFYSRPQGNGFSETCNAEINGFCVSPVVHGSGNVDSYALANFFTPKIISAEPSTSSVLGGYNLELTVSNFTPSTNVTMSYTGRNGSSTKTFIIGPFNNSEYSYNNGLLTIPIPLNVTRWSPDSPVIIRFIGERFNYNANTQNKFEFTSPVRIVSASPQTITQGFNNPLNIVFTVENYENEDLNWSPEFNISFANLIFKNGTFGGSNYSYSGRTVTIQIPSGDYPVGDMPVYIIDDIGYSINTGLVSFVVPTPPNDDDDDDDNGGSSSGRRGGTTRAQERTFEDPQGFGDVLRVTADYLSPYLLKLEIADAPDSAYSGEGIVYQVYEFTSNRDANEITEGKITFEVNKAWMENNNIDPDSISMYRKSGGERSWTKLSTVKNPSGTYTAYTDRFSLFAIISSIDEQDQQGEEDVDIVTPGDDFEEELPPPVFEEEEADRMWMYIWAGIIVLIIGLIIMTLILIKKHTKTPEKKTPPSFSDHSTPSSLYGQKPLIIPGQSKPVVKKVIKKQLKNVDQKPKVEGNIPSSQELNQLKAYVDSCLNKGFNLLRIRNKLIGAGWNKEAIDHLVVQENQEFIRKKKNRKDDLKHYVAVCRQKNVTDDRIKLVLQKAGWKEQDIEEALTSSSGDITDSVEKTL